MRKIVNDFNKDSIVQVNVYLLKFKLKVYSPLKKMRSLFKKKFDYLNKVQKVSFNKKEKPFRYSLLIISFFFYESFFISKHANYAFLYFTHNLKFFAIFCLEFFFQLLFLLLSSILQYFIMLNFSTFNLIFFFPCFSLFSLI